MLIFLHPFNKMLQDTAWRENDLALQSYLINL